MRIAITSTGKDLASDVEPRFGRAAYFIITEKNLGVYTVVENSQNLNLPQGAGIQAGKTIVENKVDVVITGDCGLKAFQVLRSAGIDVVTGAKGRIKEVVGQFRRGELISKRLV